ncbi:DUF4268 domain-containing protein [bacterium]|nr:MAG: DUF4268 domain-containing protein [bacterium]
MNDLNIGRLERVPLREVWKHEAHDFTHWLQSNLDVLSDAVDLNLISAEREKAAGSFSIDLVAEEENGSTVIIENQLEKSNHDHLGKLITYLSAIAAKAAVWIVSDPRPEHVAAVAWLNESSSADFYMVKVEAVRIGTSPAAPLFTLIVGPSEATEEVGQTKKEIAERYGIRKRWWTLLVQRSKTITKLHAHITPGEYSWIGTSAGVRGLNFNYVVAQDDCSSELYIDRGKGAETENMAIYDQLEMHKSQIDQTFGGVLSWQRLEGKRACRIRYTQPGGYRSSEEAWPEIQDDIITAMDKLETALRPYLRQINTTALM